MADIYFSVYMFYAASFTKFLISLFNSLLGFQPFPYMGQKDLAKEYTVDSGYSHSVYIRNLFFYKNTLYKNTEARFSKKYKNEFRTCSASHEKLK